MVIRRGWGGDNVLDEYYTWPTELVAVLYNKGTLGLTAGHGVISCRQKFESVAAALPKARLGTDADREVKKNGWMIRWMFAWELENHEIPKGFLLALEEQN